MERICHSEKLLERLGRWKSEFKFVINRDPERWPFDENTGNINLFAGFSTDHRKKLELEFRFNTSRGFNNYSSNTYSGIELSFKPANYLTLSLDPGFSKSYTELQYVSQEDYNGSDRYVFASIDRKTISASFRINFNLSPDLTVQYWGQPFIASGKYHNYKYITDPKADRYMQRFKTYIAVRSLRMRIILY
jgi:hypothetical protein